ncbi:hypothetical protein K439DRAFT_1072675 [Ramaria rubella]|nr:hypothetical protein K439DRAFT_1072675 [Ramaria rubella]
MPKNLHESPPELVRIIASYTHDASICALQNTHPHIRRTIGDSCYSRTSSAVHFARLIPSQPWLPRLHILAHSELVQTAIKIATVFRFNPAILITAPETNVIIDHLIPAKIAPDTYTNRKSAVECISCCGMENR